MKNILLTLLVFNSLWLSAQETQLILNKNNNDLWFETLKESEELPTKIELINQRLRIDINVYIKWEFSDGITVQRIPKLDSIRKIRTEGFCKPLYILKFKSKQIGFRIENPITDNKTNSVAELLNTDNISGIDIWTDDERQVIYGRSADCGIIFLNTNKRKVFRSFKNLKLTNFYMDEIMNY
jgi:hypothetical protein